MGQRPQVQRGLGGPARGELRLVCRLCRAVGLMAEGNLGGWRAPGVLTADSYSSGYLRAEPVAAAAKAAMDGNSQSGVTSADGAGVAPQPGRP